MDLLYYIHKQEQWENDVFGGKAGINSNLFGSKNDVFTHTHTKKTNKTRASTKVRDFSSPKKLHKL